MRDQRELELELRELSSRLELPPEPDIASSVRATLRAPQARTSWDPVGLHNWRGVIAAAAAVLLLTAVGLLASPTTRHAVADWIGLDGLRIGSGEVEQESLGTDLNLGARSGLDAAVERAGFVIGVPALLGQPDEVYVTDDPERISLVYAPTEGLPRTATTRVGLLLSTFSATLGDDVAFKKTMSAGTDIERIDVEGSPGYWISGDAHALFYFDERGNLLEDRGRLAGNTLAWQRDGLVYRIESALSKERALEIARSIP